MLARRVHSRYDRRLADAAIAGQGVVLRLRVRRFFCDSTECRLVTFTEQPAGVATRHARRTPLSRAMLTSIGVALATRPAQLDCALESICETCTYFQPTIEFRPIPQRQRDDAAAEDQTGRQELFNQLLTPLDNKHLDPLDKHHPHNPDVRATFARR